MLKKKSRAKLAPTEKQIAYAKSLGIENPEKYSRKQLARLIEQKVIKKTLPVSIPNEKIEHEHETNHQVAEPETEVVEAVEEEEAETVIEYPGYTGIQDAIKISIPISRNRDIFRLLKRKKMYGYENHSLFEEFLLFLRRIGAKRDGDVISVLTDNDDGIFSPAYVRTVLDTFFVQYSWKYVD